MTNWNPVADVREDTFYRRPRIWAVLAPLGMCLLSVTFLIPEHVPLAALGPIGSVALFFAKYLPTVLKVIFYAAWSAHGLEAWLALKVCRQKGIHPDTTRWWVISTFIFGLFSFKYLIEYEPKQEKAE